jgi:molecular chaperone HtpG
MITIPQLFGDKLSLNLSLAADVRKTFDLFEPWLEQSGMPFFPGFTDHSPRHINDVLTTAASLIADDSHDLLSAEDVAVLCMAVLLHDCGMHLTQDSFRQLAVDFGPPLITGFGDLPWGQMWNDFLSEANRFGQDKLTALFGDAQPIKCKEIDLNNLSERDCLLIGEFVRRHHTRLAHEIAIKGVSRVGAAPIKLTFLDEDICDLAGLVARSHGMSIRQTFGYLESKYTTIAIYRKIKPPYLMAVLRIADYVQVQSERAIKTLLSVKELRSPVSRQEWLNHFAVKDVTTEHADPEAFLVNAAPKDVGTYLRLVALFKDIQRELDESWATLGEVYGRSKSLNLLGLTMRRIRSNLDSTATFAKTVQYIPVKANFDSSGPDLLRLLVGPLYDYEYEVGIRELVQNAIDACRERLAFVKTEDDFDKNSLWVKVEVQETDDGTGWVTITDNGVGMTLETVTRYFLIAGASFRNSDAWKRKHVDENGQAKIIRGGRFGVGALAAFLLGGEVQVTTRHVDRSEFQGITFSARIDDPVVELKRCVAPMGTQIKIFVSDREVFDNLRPSIYGNEKTSSDGNTELRNWTEVDWYMHPTPIVHFAWTGFNFPERSSERRHIYNGRYSPDAEFMVPDLDEDTTGWQSLSDPTPYSRVLWRYSNEAFDRKDYGYVSDEITLNGILVKDDAHSNVSHGLPATLRNYVPPFRIARPSMAISDPAGICPINLQRSAISYDRMGTEVKLAEAILQWHFEKLRQPLSECSTLADLFALHEAIKSTSGVTYDCQVGPICCTRQGIMLFTSENIRRAGVSKLIFIDCDLSSTTLEILELIHDDEAIVLRFKEAGAQARASWFRAFFHSLSSVNYSYYHRDVGIPYFPVAARVQYMQPENWSYVSSKKRVARYILDAVETQKIGAHVFVSIAMPEPLGNIKERFARLITDLPGDAELGIWVLDEIEPLGLDESVLEKMWRVSFGDQYFAI